MFELCRILSPPTIVAAAAITLLSVGCNKEPTHPAIPTIAAQYAGTRYCSQWSCAYGDCYLHSDWDGGSCCLQWTLNQEDAVARPGYCSQTKNIGSGTTCGGKYFLDYGTTSAWTDDVWYCDVSQSCCAGGSGNPNYYFNPDNGVVNNNCPPGATGSACNVPNPPSTSTTNAP